MAKEIRRFDLEERTLKFSQRIFLLIKNADKSFANNEICKQLMRAAGSIGANYIEANEALSKKDFLFRVKICKKESKETRYWLNIILIEKDDLNKQKTQLIQEATEFMNIFGSIIRNSGK
jgi:four helix bundle protein